MRAYGQTKLGFYPLPLVEADRLKNWLCFSEQFSVLDPCVGDGAAFTHLLHGVTQPAPASLVEEAIDAASIVVFGQRPLSLSGKRRRARSKIAEQPSLFSLS